MGHPINMVHIDIDEVNDHPNLIENLIAARQTGIVVRRAVSQNVIAKAVKSMGAPTNESLWESPNTGMQGGEIRTIGAAATPTFTAFRGPTAQRYGESAQAHALWDAAIFGRYLPPVSFRGSSALFLVDALRMLRVLTNPPIGCPIIVVRSIWHSDLFSSRQSLRPRYL